jgi:hypothetical protein
MALFNTINFLPAVFQSKTNQRFLGATLDQLTTDPLTTPVNGYIGRRFSPTYKIGDNYVPEPSVQRNDYQLEPSVVVKDKNKNILFTTGYIDLLNGIGNNNGLPNDHQRLFSSESYSYDSKFDYDKFVNYYNYFWLPDGPEAVSVVTNEVPYSKTYTVTRNTTAGGYNFTSLGSHPNLQLTLARGGNYTFNIDQPGIEFWIQSVPGTSGTDANIPTVNTRQVYGVKNNGVDQGTITFNVPLDNAQDFYTTMPSSEGADVAIDLHYTDLQNQPLSDLLRKFPKGLDGIVNTVLLQNTTFVFTSNDRDDVYWTTPAIGNGLLTQSQINSSVIAQGSIVTSPKRTSVWRTSLVPTVAGDDYIIQIFPVYDVAVRSRVFVRSGITYASNQFWLDDTRRYQPVPLLTAPQDYLYYQDSENPDFFGQIKLVNNSTSTIDVARDIIGKSGYTSHNGVIFTNGLKISFDEFVTPSEYANNEYYVEGVGTSISLVPAAQMTVAESFGANIPTTPDYLTINRASQDRNSWSRSNRWFHKDVILSAAAYNNADPYYGPNIAGRRPIIEFDAGLQLFNYGLKAKSNVNYIITGYTDAFNDFEGRQEGTVEASVDGIELKTDDRIVFANDFDTTIIDQVWRVQFEIINSTSYLTLVPTVDNPVAPGENVLITNGSHTGETFRFDGTAWYQCQAKTSVNQTPMFDLVDANGYSFADATVYPNSTFATTKNNLGDTVGGSQIFGYAQKPTGTDDILLGFPLTYKNFNNIGDIVFNNYYDVESFSYVEDQQTKTLACNSGYFVIGNGLSGTTKQNNWVETVENTNQFQIFTKFFDGSVVTINTVDYAFVQIDVLPEAQTTVPHIKVYLNNSLLIPTTDYQIVKYGVYNLVTLNATPAVGDKIDVAVFSTDASATAYYAVPENLNLNSLNENFTEITLGQLRTHYNKLIENTARNLTNNIPLQDHYIRAQGGTLVNHSAPLIYAMTFLNDPTVNFVDGLSLARKEYTKFKNKFLTLCSTIPSLNPNDPAGGVDTILKNINAIKNNSFPWFYSDMVPQGSEYTSINYTVLNALQKTYKITNIFNSAELSNRAIIIYVDGLQQRLGIEYTFSTISPSVVFTRPFAVGSKIVIREYNNTDGNYIPETPTKLGLYPKFTPEIYLDTTYQTPTEVLLGHDGSITPTFGDFRDYYLLELELRIFNNIKTDYNKNQLNVFDILPGRFRTTEYNLDEYNAILSQNFLTWVGVNAVNYISNTTYDANNPWTWNYGSYKDGIDGSPLQGSWRAIYKYWYDTDTPNLTPWIMLGLFDKPTWWEDRYGPGPYTKGNTLLWQDLEAGYIWNNGSPYNDSRFARSGLTGFIPVDSAGNLLSPVDIPVTNVPSISQFNSSYSGADFAVGQQGPTETAWRRSSDYPYAIQLAMALTKPARYFATQIDTSRFYVNSITGQFSNVYNRHVSPKILKVNGDATSGTIQRTSGYVNWIADQIKNLGIDPITKITEYFSNLSTQLTYKVGGFTDSSILTITAEQTTPSSTGGSVIIPDTNYNIYLHKSVPVLSPVYSAVIVEKTQTGYAVTGYDPATPFFTIIPSLANSNTSTIVINDVAVQLYNDSTNTAKTIPYGTELPSIQQVADFLISYERYLVAQGFQFTYFDKDLEQIRNWSLSVKELLNWSQQGWAAGNIIVLNPIATRLSLQSFGAVVDEITNVNNGNKVLDQNFLPIKNNNFNILRTENSLRGNNFIINTLNGSMITYAKLNLVQYEHTIIFDNVDDFGAIIYIPSQGTRQYRLKLAGHKTAAWSGALSAPGYIYNDPMVSEWNSGTDYRLGDIVKYNNFYYTAMQDIVASTTFNSIQWTQIQQDAIQTGLLSNFGLNAQQFTRIYDVDNPPINETFQAYSASLIGFRQRQYLTDLGISIPTQTKFYQGYIKEKGSLNAITALTKANFNNVNSEINLYEEWAFRTGLYGGLESNTFKEFILDQSVFNTNPVAFTSTTAYVTGNIIVSLNGNATSTDIAGNINSNVYTSSDNQSTSTTLYSNRTETNYLYDLPTAGYVNINDVDYTIFDISTGAIVANTIVVGDKVWVAKNIHKNWDIFRTDETELTATTLTYVLDSYGQLTFDNVCDFEVGDVFVLKDFNTNFDGIYTVIEKPSSSIVTISISNVIADTTDINAISPLQALIRRLTVTGFGSVFKLRSVRFANLTERNVADAPLNDWQNTDFVWVDDIGDGTWGVYQWETTDWSADPVKQEQPQVDINTISRVFIYNKSDNNILAALDYIDPNKGKILNSAAQDIDYQLDDDPALYNQGTVTLHSDLHWGTQQVGQIWWNIDTVRYIDYEQDKNIYRLNHWGEQFPGSSIDVYQWVESTTLPSQYTGTGIPLHADDSAYCTYGYVDSTGNVRLKYYFWVKNIDSIDTDAGKNNSIISITNVIKNPQNQGIPYAAILRDDTVALYNVNTSLVGKNSVIHLGRTSGEINLIHSEYALVQEGNPQSPVPTNISSKLIDSLAGLRVYVNPNTQEEFVEPVPNPRLPPSQRYGIDRGQTMIINRELALSNYITLINAYLLDYPVVERKVLTILNSNEAVPSVESKTYNFIVDTIDELSYINVADKSAGYKVLVNSDRTNAGKWAIYELDADESFFTIDPVVQNYKTNLYWSYADWYDVTYDPTSNPDVTVANRFELGKLTFTSGQYVKVLNNGNNQFVVYYVDSSLNLNLVGTENGTIQISTGTIPGRELRQILLAMRQNILIDDLLTEYNVLFFAMIKYILTEQKNIDWAFKTSFISAAQQIRKLRKFPAYVPDNQSYYLSYINEVKPYRTVVREFVVDYVGNDSYDSDVTDFDLPPYYDANLSIYRSPNGRQPYDNTIKSQGVYSQWNQNYKYAIVDISVEYGGSGYTYPPQIGIQGGGGSGATAYAVLDGYGSIASIIMTNPGSGYTSTPTVIINGSGTGAIGRAILRNVYDGSNNGHNLVRSITSTIKFDRITYSNPTKIVFWSNLISRTDGGNLLYPNTIVANNSIINLDNKLFKLSIEDYRDYTDYVPTSTYIYYQGNVDVPGNTYITSNNIVIPTTPWAANTSFDLDSYISFNSDTYIVTGNVYGMFFSNIVINADPVNNVIKSKFEKLVERGNVLVHISGKKGYQLTSNVAGAVDFPINNVATFNSADFDNANDRIVAFFGDIALENVVGGVGYPGVIIEGGNLKVDGLSRTVGSPAANVAIDAVVSSMYTDSLGVNPRDIKIDGGAYVDEYASHAPEELVPGRMYDSLSISVFDTSSLGFRILEDMNYNSGYYRIANANTTTLSSNVSMTDTLIHVADANKLPEPNAALAIPGVVFINGEKIVYYTRDTVNNTIGQLRRAVDGTSIHLLHATGTRVIDSSIQQQFPVSTDARYRLNSNVTYTLAAKDSVTYGVRLTSKITANVGDLIIQKNLANEVASVMTILENVDNASVVPVRILSGSVIGLPDAFDANKFSNLDPVTYRIASASEPTTRLKPTVPTWTANILTLATPWEPNLSVASGTDISYNGTAYTTIGNIYSNITVTAWSSNTIFASNSYITNNSFIYRVTGNVYGSTFANANVSSNVSLVDIQTLSNVAGNLRVYYPIGSIMYHSGNLYEVRGNVYGSNFANVTTNSGYITKVYDWSANVNSSKFATLSNVGINSIITNDNGTTFYATIGNVFDAGGTFANISSNILPYTSNVINAGPGVTTTTNPLQDGDQWWDTATRSLYEYSSSSWIPYSPAFGGLGFDNATPPISVAGNDTTVYVMSSYILGQVDTNGKYVVTPVAELSLGNLWYNPGAATPTDGRSLINSSTEVANFLKASKSFRLAPGQTP